MGHRLVQAAEQWAAGQGCREMGSDLGTSNEVSLRSHLAQGYTEAERLIHMIKPIRNP